MFSLSQSMLVKGQTGEPLPYPFTGLQQLEVQFRRGEFSLICAAGGTGKSLLGLYLAIFTGVPCLYMSADSTAFVQLARATAMITGEGVRQVMESIADSGLSDRHREALDRRGWLRFCYHGRPTPQDIETNLKCYQEVFGCPPHLVVVDNVSNVDIGSGANSSDYTFGLEGLCDYLSDMAREVGCHVLGMHHVVGEFGSGTVPAPLCAVKGKISRVPSVVLTVHAKPDGLGGRVLHVAPVKNRQGFADPSGTTYARLLVDPVNLRITDLDDEDGVGL